MEGTRAVPVALHLLLAGHGRGVLEGLDDQVLDGGQAFVLQDAVEAQHGLEEDACAHVRRCAGALKILCILIDCENNQID